MMSSLKKRTAAVGALILTALMLQGCNMFGNSDVEIAPYTVLEKQDDFELRTYEQLILVTTTMKNREEARGPFQKLFKYISGQNTDNKEIAMTAPVFMDQKDQKSETMSFVLPKSFTIENAPVPNDPDVKLESLRDYTVATIRFNGRLSQENIEHHKKLLRDWIAQKEYKVIGPSKAAGYNPPFTIPQFRRNEVMIPVEKPAS